MKISKIAYISAKSGMGSLLKDALIDLEKETALEAGCLYFSFYQSVSDSENFILIECFVDVQALDWHMQSPHAVKFFRMDLVKSIVVSDIAEGNLPPCAIEKTTRTLC